MNRHCVTSFYLLMHFLFLGLESVTNCTLFFEGGSEISTDCFSSLCFVSIEVSAFVTFSSFLITISFIFNGVSSFKTSLLSSWVTFSTSLTKSFTYGVPNSNSLKLTIEQYPSDEDTMSNRPSEDLKNYEIYKNNGF